MDSQEIIQKLSAYPYFWFVDFDRSAWVIPENWDELNQKEKSEIIYNQSSFSDDEWEEYLG